MKSGQISRGAPVGLVVPVASTRHAVHGSPGCRKARICLSSTRGGTPQAQLLEAEADLSRMTEFALNRNTFSLLG